MRKSVVSAPMRALVLAVALGGPLVITDAAYAAGSCTPTTPTNVMGYSAGAGNATATWTASTVECDEVTSEKIDHYVVRLVSIGGVEKDKTNVAPGQTLSHQVSDLPTDQYFFQVTAVEEDADQSPFANSNFFNVTGEQQAPQAPPTPTHVSANYAGPGRIAISWEENGSSSYGVTLENLDDPTRSKSGSAVTSPYLATDVKPGRYVAKVVGRNGPSASAAGVSQQLVVSGQGTFPEAPASVTATRTAPGTIKVDWVPAEQPTEQVDYWWIKVDDNVVDQVTRDTTTHTLTGLSIGDHKIAVMAVDTDTEGSKDTVAATVANYPVTAPVLTVASQSGASRIDLAWTASSVNQGESTDYGLVRYDVDLTPIDEDGQATGNVDHFKAGTATSLSNMSLAPGRYRVQVQAVWDNDADPIFRRSSATQDLQVYAAPGAPAITATPTSPRKVTVGLTPPSGDHAKLSAYYLTQSVPGGQPIEKAYSPSTTKVVVNDLVAGQKYSFTVRAMDVHGQVSEVANAEATAYDVSAPQTPKATQQGTDLTVTWSAPAQGTPKNYHVELYAGDTLKQKSFLLASNVSSTTFDHVGSNIDKVVVVATYDDADQTTRSTELPLDVKAGPEAPSITEAVQPHGRAAALKVSWEDPTRTYGFAGQHYVVTATKKDASIPADTKTVSSASSARTVTFTDLEPGTYDVKVVYDVADGTDSADVKSATVHAAPAAVTAAKATATDGQVAVTWTDSVVDQGDTDGSIDYYEVRQVSPATEATPRKVYAFKDPVAYFYGLETGTEHTYEIVAVDARGLRSQAETAQATAYTLTEPEITQANETEPHQVVVDWLAPKTVDGHPVLGYDVALTKKTNPSIIGSDFFAEAFGTSQGMQLPTYQKEGLPADTTSWTFEDVGQGVYTARVHALYADNEVTSDSWKNLEVQGYTHPDAATVTRVAQVGNGTVDVAFTPGDDRGFDIDHYEVLLRSRVIYKTVDLSSSSKNSSSSPIQQPYAKTVTVLPGQTTTASFADVPVGDYEATVYTYPAVKVEPARSERTLVTVAALPGAVRDLAAAQSGDDAASLTWAAPVANGATLTGYRVTAGGTSKMLGAAELSTLVSGLAPGSHRFTVTPLGSTPSGVLAGEASVVDLVVTPVKSAPVVTAKGGGSLVEAGHKAVVGGSAAQGDVLQLQLRELTPGGARVVRTADGFTVLGRATADRTGRYAFTTRFRRNVEVRVVNLTTGAVSPVRVVEVAKDLTLRKRRVGAHAYRLTGVMRPGDRGEVVRLLVRRGSRFVEVAQTTTGKDGRFGFERVQLRRGKAVVKVVSGANRTNAAGGQTRRFRAR